MNTCKNCDGRGWFSSDMMGNSFFPCEKCNTYEQCEDGIHVRQKQSQYAELGPALLRIIETVSENPKRFAQLLKTNLHFEQWCELFDAMDEIASQSEYTEDGLYNPMAWECEQSPIGTCLYDLDNDPAMDNCVYCHEPYERK